MLPTGQQANHESRHVQYFLLPMALFPPFPPHILYAQSLVAMWNYSCSIPLAFQPPDLFMIIFPSRMQFPTTPSEGLQILTYDSSQISLEIPISYGFLQHSEPSLYSSSNFSNFLHFNKCAVSVAYCGCHITFV